MCGWGDEVIKVYLLGNPMIWWSGFAAIICMLFCSLLHVLRWQRGYATRSSSTFTTFILESKNACINKDAVEEDWRTFVFTILVCVGGWAFHFFPFALMGRVTYLHHYFPALYFAILSTAFLIEHTLGCCQKTKVVVNVAIGAVVTSVFAYFAPLSYGFSGPASAYANRRWLSSWTMS